ncbi:protein seele [Thrips palmi]|uniref:Protein seele n=1 Tax=Thrips palmi TaxID=161013 RepID=A0A6P8ZP43_THRPL|nr:protein seele [Thrips palmi]
MAIYSLALLGFVAVLLPHSIYSSNNLSNLRCLICEQIVQDLQIEINKIDPKKKVEVGNYRLDAEGNSKQNLIPYALSEMQISDSLEVVCKGIDDYVRATRKDTGELILMKLIIDGKMNPVMSDVDIIQDGDLNKSLKYYCDGIVEEYEENIVELFQKKETSIESKLCQDVANLCRGAKAHHEDL